jgi:hypothetical protein
LIELLLLLLMFDSTVAARQQQQQQQAEDPWIEPCGRVAGCLLRRGRGRGAVSVLSSVLWGCERAPRGRQVHRAR